MSVSTRRQLGAVLLALAGISAIVAFVVMLSHGDFVAGSGVLSVSGSLSADYFIPIAVFGILGVLCLKWPAPKPPRLP